MPFTQDWSSSLYHNLRKCYTYPVQTKMTCLEVGCFEGLGTNHINEFLCLANDSIIYCVDPWEDRYAEQFFQEGLDAKFVGQYQRFLENTQHIKDKLVKCRGYSNDVLPSLPDDFFDFIYLDGLHTEEQIYLDAKLSFPKLKVGGVMAFDDLNMNDCGVVLKVGIDKFLDEIPGKYETLFSNYQLWIRKTS
jgi:hypothetical protein